MSQRVSEQLEDLAAEYVAASDIFTVIGCSHGKTGLDNGNALLAVGQSKRVQQQLVDLGVPVNRILDELLGTGSL